MLDNSISEGGTARRRSTFYVPLCESEPDEVKSSKSSKKSEKNHLDKISFSPFKRTPKKSLTPPIYEVQEPTPKKTQSSTPLYTFASSKSIQQQQQHRTPIQTNRPKCERTPVRIAHLQQPQKPKTLDTSKLLKTPSVSVPSLDHSFHRIIESNSQSLETLKLPETCKPTFKSSNPFVKRTDSAKLSRAPSHRTSKTAAADKSTSKISFSSATLINTDSSSVPTISALPAPQRDPKRLIQVPFVLVERDDLDVSGYSEKTTTDKNYLHVADDDDAGIHSGKL